MDEKKCFKCGQTKPLADFYRHSAMADGHLNKCKACTKSDVAKHREDNLDQVKEYDRQRNQQPGRIAARREYLKKYRAKYPESNRAHQLVCLAIRRGELKALPCEACGVTEDVHAHHDDYSKPLDVRWLCPIHHVEHHAKLRRQAAKN